MLSASDDPLNERSRRPDSQTIEILQKAMEFLHREVEGTSIAARTGETCRQTANHIAERFRLFRSQRPARVCALVLGEFNAGKSTLINALVGRVVAATDVFEMTHAVCTLIPGEPGVESVELRSSDTGKPLILSLEQFLTRCQRRDLGSY